MNVIKNILSEEERKHIIKCWEEYGDIVEDHQAVGTKVIRLPEFLFPYLEKVKPIIEEDSGYKLTGKYTAIRLYKKGDKLAKHTDNAAEFAISIIVDQSDQSDNFLVFYDDTFETTVNLGIGEGCYFRGTRVPHERLEVQSDYILHIYLGYDIATHVI